MTLIVGIKCSDGIVVGADGAATLGELGNRTIQQPVRKLQILSHKVIIGVSGKVGLGQRIIERVGDLYADGKLSGKKPGAAMGILRSEIWPDIFGEIQAAQIAQPLVGPQIAQASAISQTIVALPLNKQLSLIYFDQQGSPEEATQLMCPFVCVGSGQQTADPFLAFIRKIFWQAELPSLEMGIFSTFWTLQHSIETNPGGVADPKQIIVLEKTGGDFKARELSLEEIAEHYEAVTAAESALRDFKTLSHASVSSSVSASPPEPP
jgi:hypothetical protein